MLPMISFKKGDIYLAGIVFTDGTATKKTAGSYRQWQTLQ
jgi:hypothetical protein